MWIPFSTPSTRRSRRNRTTGLAVAGLLVLASPVPAGAQQVVFDPRNHLENALQAARQLESLANEARSLAASPYSHLAGSSQSLRDMAELARTARGLATSVSGLERQFETYYPDDLAGADVLRLLEQSGARTATNQLLAVLAEDLAALRTLMLAQSRLMAEATAREAADRASGEAARRQRWAGAGAVPVAPSFDPFARARD